MPVHGHVGGDRPVYGCGDIGLSLAVWVGIGLSTADRLFYKL